VRKQHLNLLSVAPCLAIGLGRGVARAASRASS
jgi:hypothetical protein